MKNYLVLDDLKTFIYSLVEKKKTMLISIGIGTLLGLILAFTISPMYQSKGIYEVTLEDLESKSQLSPFQQDIFNPFGTAGDPRAYKVIELLNSRNFVLDFIKKYNLKRDLYAVKSYDKSSGIITYSSIVDDQGNWIRGKEPNDEKTFELFKVYYDVSYDIESGFIHISAIHYSQFKAKEWVELLVFEANELLRKIDLMNAEAAIEYYEQQISEAMSEDLINVITRLLEEEMRKKMLANVRQDYALSILDPAFFPDEKYSPSRFLILLFALFLSFIIGSCVVYYDSIKSRFNKLIKKPDV